MRLSRELFTGSDWLISLMYSSACIFIFSLNEGPGLDCGLVYFRLIILNIMALPVTRLTCTKLHQSCRAIEIITRETRETGETEE